MGQFKTGDLGQFYPGVDTMAPGGPRLLDQVRNTCRVRHLSIQIDKAHIDWIRRSVICHGKGHASDWDEEHIDELPSMQ